jgi:UDP-glucose 4-epimerase
MTQTIWVTGADGFIGRHLVGQLHAGGAAEIGALGYRDERLPPDPAAAATIWQVGEIDHGQLDALAERTGPPPIIYHLAGGGSVGASIADPWFDFRCTVLSSAAIADWLRQHAPAARMVQISSAAVYGAGHNRAIAETATTEPYSPYGAHKLMAEALCRSAQVNYGIDTVVVRPFSVYGPGLRKQLLWDSCNRIVAGCDTLDLGGTGNELRDWFHVEDLCNLIIQLGTAPHLSDRLFNGGTGRALSVADIARMLVTAWGRPDMPVRFSGQSRPGDPFALVADTARIDALGFVAKQSADIGIADFVTWFRTL